MFCYKRIIGTRLALAALALAMTAGTTHAALLGEWTFNTGGTTALRLESSSNAPGVAVSSLMFNDSFTDFGPGTVPNDVHDGIGFGGNLGEQVMFLHRANYFDGSAVPVPRPSASDYTSFGDGAGAGTGSNLSSNGNAPFAFTVSADANKVVRVDSLSIALTSGGAIIWQVQEAGSVVGPSITLAGPNPLSGTAMLSSPIIVGAGQTKTFTINVNSGALNTSHNVNELVLNGVSTYQVFGDPFTAVLGFDPEPNQNVNVPGRQTGVITGDWTQASGTGGAGGARDVYLTNSGSLLDGTALLNRIQYNATGASIVSQAADSVNFAAGVAGSKYVISGSMVLDDSQGSNPLSGTGLNSYRAGFGLTDVVGGFEGQGVMLRFETLDASTWTWELRNDNTILESGALVGFGFGDRVEIALSIDETGVQDTAAVSFTYDAITITSSLHNVTLGNLTSRHVRGNQRYFVLADYADNPNLILDAQFDNVNVAFVPECSTLALLGLGLSMGMGAVLIRRIRG